jgi:hypothetical protein
MQYSKVKIINNFSSINKYIYDEHYIYVQAALIQAEQIAGGRRRIMRALIRRRWWRRQ